MTDASLAPETAAVVRDKGVRLIVAAQDASAVPAPAREATAGR